RAPRSGDSSGPQGIQLARDHRCDPAVGMEGAVPDAHRPLPRVQTRNAGAMGLAAPGRCATRRRRRPRPLRPVVRGGAMAKVADLVRVSRDGRGSVPACDGVSFEVPSGKFFTLLGPSGCGKTTTLRSIAGLERPDSGEIALEGAVVYSSRSSVFVPPNG